MIEQVAASMPTLAQSLSSALEGFADPARFPHDDKTHADTIKQHNNVIRRMIVSSSREDQYPSFPCTSAIDSSMMSIAFSATSLGMMIGGLIRRICPAGIHASPFLKAV